MGGYTVRGGPVFDVQYSAIVRDDAGEPTLYKPFYRFQSVH